MPYTPRRTHSACGGAEGACPRISGAAGPGSRNRPPRRAGYRTMIRSTPASSMIEIICSGIRSSVTITSMSSSAQMRPKPRCPNFRRVGQHDDLRGGVHHPPREFRLVDSRSRDAVLGVDAVHPEEDLRADAVVQFARGLFAQHRQRLLVHRAAQLHDVDVLRLVQQHAQPQERRDRCSGDATCAS